jgi:hypothetical protein
MKEPKQPPAYDVRFERGRFVLHARAKEARVAPATRLDPSARIGSGVMGFFLFLLGAGMTTAFAFNLRAMGLPRLSSSGGGPTRRAASMSSSAASSAWESP